MNQSQNNLKILTGIDLVKIERVEKAMKRNDTFLTKNFSSEELINSSPESISGKFAAKEAIIKAFGDIQKLKLSEIKIINSSSGKPTFELINDKMNIISKDLSITHTEDNAIASVVILTNEL